VHSGGFLRNFPPSLDVFAKGNRSLRVMYFPFSYVRACGVSANFRFPLRTSTIGIRAPLSAPCFSRGSLEVQSFLSLQKFVFDVIPFFVGAATVCFRFHRRNFSKILDFLCRECEQLFSFSIFIYSCPFHQRPSACSFYVCRVLSSLLPERGGMFFSPFLSL